MKVIFFIFKVCFGVSFCIFHFAATSVRKLPAYNLLIFLSFFAIYHGEICFAQALLTKYSSIPVLVATAIFSYMSGLMHFMQSLLLFKAIKVTKIARQAMNFGNSIMGKQDANIEGNEEIKNESVAYKKDKDDIVMDPTQTVY